MRIRTLALSLIPGAAQVDLGRPGRGLLFFILFVFCANGALVAPLVLGARGARVGGILAASGIWIAAFWDAWRLAAGAGKKAAAGAAESAEKKEVGKPVA